ncbi:MAG: flagellar basal body P-ring formation protein FlgA [Methylocystaceae bacterium]|nr:flagellar basal body P-ring formation protein FlgA [Methylocystaceae bacterium]
MKRIIHILSVLTFLLAAPALAGTSSDKDQKLTTGNTGPVTLRENIVVSTSYIRLGDLFTNVPLAKEKTAIAYSPKPGRRASFDARWLYRVARAYGLQWRPLSANLSTMVTRDSIVIDKDEIQDAVTSAMQQYDLPENARIELSNRNLRIHVSTEIMPEVRVDDITFNRHSNRFAAIVAIGEKDMNATQRIRVTGQVLEMLNIPTLSRNVPKGEVISENDISWVQMRADRTQQDIILDAATLIGMSPKRTLRADRPIRARDIQEPVLVPKGSLVTIILKKPGLTLTSRGRAMENGSDGETIRVTNTKTSRTIDAVVIGSSMVTVLPAGSNIPQLAYNQ